MKRTVARSFEFLDLVNHSDRIAQEAPLREGIRRPRIGIALAVALVSIGLSGCFRVSTDVGALRDSVMKAARAAREERIEIGVGPLTLNLARAGLAFVDLEPEARSALHAVRSAEVGVYKLRSGHQQLNLAAMLSAADKTMAGRGWDRVVGVMDRRELVAIYVPAQVRSTRNVRVCLLTVDGQELVVASARSNLEPLMALAWNRAGRHQVDLSPLRLSASERGLMP